MEPSSCRFVSTSKSQREATTRSLLSQMDSEQCQFIVALDPQPQTRCCSCCGQQGHNVRTCPQKTQQDTTTRNSPSSSRTRSEDHHNDHRSSSKRRRTSVDTPRYTLDRTIYVVFDLETTGFSRFRCHIIEIAAEILDPDGIPFEDGRYSSLVKPPKAIPPIVVDLTGINNDMVKSARRFHDVAIEFFAFIDDKRQMFEEGSGEEATRIVLVAHNGKRFDLLFLMEELKRNNLWELIDDDRYGYGIDTMILAKAVTRDKNLPLPASYKLSALYEHITGKDMEPSAHRALVDVKATSTILRYPSFWEDRKKHFFFFRVTGSATNETTDDSDLDVEVDDNSDNDELLEDTSENTTVMGWEKNVDFDGYDAMGKFQEVFEKRNTRLSQGDRTGLQCSVNSVNSPTKSWRQIFTNSILDKIVLYTNQYGEQRSKEWYPISRQDITDFIAILFLSK